MTVGGDEPLTSLNCGWLHLGPAQEIVDLNDVLASWRGSPRDELVGKALDTILSRGSWMYWDTTVEPILEQQGHAWDLALKLSTEQGPPVEVLVNARRNERGTQCILFPFSGRLLWEQRLREAQDQARKQQAHIERMEKIETFRREFIQTVAHELHTPMTPLHLGIQMLQHHLGTPVKPELQRSMDIIQDSMETLSKLSKSIIQSANVAAGRLDMRLQAIALGHFLPDVVHQWRQRYAPSRAIEMDVQDAVVQADPHALTTCVENLLDNAVKFSTPAAHIKAQVLAGPPAHIIIEDNGRGIEPDRLERLGRPFLQAHDRDRITTLGLGLGLHIVTGLMDAQGGSFTIQSEGLNRGTRAILEFPVRYEPDNMDSERQRSDGA